MPEVKKREQEKLNCYRAIGTKREKWEAREGRLTKELDSLWEVDLLVTIQSCMNS